MEKQLKKILGGAFIIVSTTTQNFNCQLIIMPYIISLSAPLSCKNANLLNKWCGFNLSMM